MEITTPQNTKAFERKVLFLMALVQFINIWDFMIIMPLGPDLAEAVNLSNSHVGWIASSYSISAAFVNIAAASLLDRFDRRKVLVFNLLGLALGTISMVFASTAATLILARIVTGLFGGTMIASSLAVIADVFPPERRGEAMGKVFGSFSVAAVIGVPVGLEVATYFGWWSPFILISLMALVTVGLILWLLPPITYHLCGEVQPKSKGLYLSILRNSATWPAMWMTGLSLFAGFLIIPNISAHVMLNMDYPREKLGILYFIGGISAFFSMRYVGKRSDRAGYANTALWATVMLLFALYVGYYAQLRMIPVLVVFVMFMVGMSARNVTSNALISKIPTPQERAGFMAILASVQSLFQGLGALVATFMLTEIPEGRLVGIQNVTLLSMACFMTSVFAMYHIERILRRRATIT